VTIIAEKTAAEAVHRTSSRGRTLAIALVAAGLALLFAANAHFLYVAVTSQPDCVAHSKASGSGVPGVYGAAKSAC
jgi:hypothetical protein